ADAEFYAKLEDSSAYLEKGLRSSMDDKGLNYTINRVGSMMTIFFTDQQVRDFDTAKLSDTSRFSAFFGEMLEGGVYLPPSQFEAMFVSAAHSSEDFDDTIRVFAHAFV